MRAIPWVVAALVAVGCGTGLFAPLEAGSQRLCAATAQGVAFTYDFQLTSSHGSVACAVEKDGRQGSWSYAWDAGTSGGGDGWCSVRFDLDTSAGTGVWTISDFHDPGPEWAATSDVAPPADGGVAVSVFAQYRKAGSAADGAWAAIPCADSAL